MKTSKRKKRKTKIEFSKRWVGIIMTVMLADLTLCIILNRMESLAITLVTSGVAVFGGYMFKAFFGKKAEEDNKLMEKFHQCNNEEDER